MYIVPTLEKKTPLVGLLRQLRGCAPSARARVLVGVYRQLVSGRKGRQANGLYRTFVNSTKWGAYPLAMRVAGMLEGNSLTRHATRLRRAYESSCGILVDQTKQKLHLIENGQTVETMSCSTGCGDTDNGRYPGLTTNGKYIVHEIYKSHELGWPQPEDPLKAYGPYICHLYNEDGSYSRMGIHGTHEPEKMGTPSSHGCVRLLNDVLARLVETYVYVGTPVEIVGVAPGTDSE